MSAFIFVHNIFFYYCACEKHQNHLPPPPRRQLQTLQKPRPQHLLSDYHFPVFYNYITVCSNFRFEKIYIFKHSVTSVFNSHKTQSALHKNREDRSSTMSLLFQSFNSSPIISPVCSQMNCVVWGRNFGFYCSFCILIINRKTRFGFFLLRQMHSNICKKNVKQSHYRLGHALRVTGG